jgi:hypothetical protein
MKSSKFNKKFANIKYKKNWDRLWGSLAQNFGKACQHPQNSPSDALLATILGAPIEML